MAPIQWVVTALGWLSTILWHESPEQQNATVFALQYGYPLIPFIPLAQNISKATGGVLTNIFHHNTKLSTSNSTDVVRPNVDTLYSSAIIDLSTVNLIVTVPEIEGRFYAVSFYDLYGNNFENLGTVTNSSSGQYIVRSCAVDHPSHISQSKTNTYQGYVSMPTVYGILLLRILVQNSSDVDNVVAIQKTFNLSTVAHQPCAPTLTLDTLTSGIEGTISQRILQLTARLAPYNPPEVDSDIDWVNSTLKLAGMVDGNYTQPPGVNLTAAALAALELISSVPRQPGVLLSYPNNWTAFSPDASGDFKSHYDIRAFIAYQGYLQLTADQAVYPSYNNTLFKNQSYLLTFYGKPPVDGFWSLTVYGSNFFLVDNPLDRYSLGDRSSMTYSNGSLVYGSPGDGEFQILLQTTEVAPPSNWTANWLPTPPVPTDPKPGEEQFYVNLRWYAPTEQLLNGTYKYPLVEAIQPIGGH